jgi:hypothetical protein
MADMSGINLSNTHLEDARIAGANMQAANLRGAHMNATKIAGVNLQEADLAGADLSGSRMLGVNVAGADFSDTKLTNARAAVNWADAKVQPMELPEPIAMPPRWLPVLFMGVFAVVAFLLIRRIKNK